MPELETVDLVGVEILSAGGPIHGVGSPPEGDFYSTDDLRAMAEAANELAEELEPPAKIGHSDAQALAWNSKLAPVTPGEMPRVGYLANQRVSEDGEKLVADVKDVPKNFAELIEAGAWQDRSVELSKVTSQKTGKVYDWVVTGLAWLGAKLPAVRTLDDVVALYEGEGVDLRRVILYAEGSVVWDPASSFQALRDHVAEALNGPPTGGMNSPRFWVRDVDVVGSRALVEDYFNEEMGEAWVIPFSRASDGSIGIAPSSDWTKAEQAWVEASVRYERKDDPGLPKPRADTRAMKFTDEHRRKFAEATGLEAEKVTDEMLASAGVSGETAPPVVSDEDAKAIADALGVEGEVDAAKLLEAAKAKPDDKRELEQSELTRRLESAEKTANEAKEELRLERRKVFVEGAIKEGRVKPGARAKLEHSYDEDPVGIAALVAEIEPNEELAREYGSDEEPTDEQKTEQEGIEKAYEADLASRMGVKAEELI